MDLQTIDSASEIYLGQWNRLVSTTNWEKGRIISEWRAELAAVEAPITEYSDEAWGRRVGNVTPQHVGRLRRVFDRFGEVRDTYSGLYWSHFQAALDWDDAEMWLEGAVQNGWSISEMRKTRWEATGAAAELKPNDGDIIAAEIDEDADVQTEVRQTSDPEAEMVQVRGLGDARDEREEPPFDEPVAVAADEPPVRQPFADLPSLPSDVTDAFESFKLCILRHRLAGWGEISQADLLATLDALKELASASTE